MEEFLLTIFIVLLFAKIGGEIAERMGQSSLLGELSAGVVILPVFGRFIGDDFTSLEFLSNIGMILLLFVAGLEIDYMRLKKVGRPALLTAVMGFVFPFSLGVILGDWFGLSFFEILFLATGLSITAIPVSVKILMDLKIMESRVALTIIGAGVIDDIISIVVLGVISSMAFTGQAAPGPIFFLVLKALLFLALVFTLGFRLSEMVLPAVFSLRTGEAVVTFGLLCALGLGYLAEVFGLHALVGSFAAGLILGSTRDMKDPTIQKKFESYVMGFFAPIFFAWIGISFYTAFEPTHLDLILWVVLAAIVGKFLGGGIGARLGSLNVMESLAVGIGMNGRGAVELIVAGVGFSIGVMGSNVFSALIFMALFTTLVTPIILKQVLVFQYKLHTKYKRGERRELENQV